VQAPPLILIFHGKRSAPVRRTYLTRLASYGYWPVEWYRSPSAARPAWRAADVCRVCSRARRRSRHRL